MQQKSGSFVRQLMQIGTGTIIGLVIGVFTTPVITRIVEPGIYGQFSLIRSYASVAMAFLSMGLDQALMRHYYESEDMGYRRKLFHICFLVPLFITALFAFVLLLIYPFLNAIGTDFTESIILYFIVIVFTMLVNRFSLVLLRLQYKTKLYAALNVVQRLTYLFVAVIGMLLIKDYYLQILISAVIASELICFLIVFVTEHSFFKREKTKINVDIKTLMRYGFPLMISTSVMYIFQALDRVCLSFFTDYTVIGVYASAQTLMSAFSVIQTSFNTLWTPTAIQHYEHDHNDTSYYRKMNEIITVVMFTFGASVLVLKDVFVLLLGEDYREASTIIPFLMFNPIMYTISETTVMGVYFKKKTSSQLFITVTSTIINFILNMILIPVMGAKGAAVSTGIAYIVFFVLRTYFSNKFFPVKYSLSHLYIAVVLFAGVATYHMYHSFGLVCLFLYIGYIVALIILYTDTCRYLLKVVINYVKKMRRKN